MYSEARARIKRLNIFLILFFLAFNAFAQRSFDDIFPSLNSEEKTASFSDAGFVKSGHNKNNDNVIGLNSIIDNRIVNAVLSRNPTHLVESILVIPIEQSVTLLQVYNSLGNIRALSGIEYLSHTRGQSTPLFEEATRITSERQNTPVLDPAPVMSIPMQETVFIRLKDANFGNSFYRWEMALLQHGLYYSLTNSRSLTVYFVPVIRENNLFAHFYIEPISEGVLIYSIAGANIAEIYSSRIHMNSAIEKRLAVINTWAAGCIKSTL